MSYKSKKRGFTLVEVIVTITILGVVTLVALPVITGLKSQFDTSKYKVYESSLESAGKLFVDANLEDVFGNEESGCAEVKYDALVEKRLLEDISIDGVTCFNAQTFVRARKNGSKIEYETSLYCTQNGNEVYSNVLSGSEECASENESGPPSIIISPKQDINKIYKNNGAQIRIHDRNGLSENQKLKIEWRKDSVDGTVESVKEENITIARGKIDHTISVNTPSGKTGNYYLVVTPIDVKDINANQTNDVVSKGPFKLDNSAPKINVKVYKFDGTNKIGDPVMTKTNNSNVQITTWSTNGYYFDFSGTTDTGSTKLNEVWEWNPTGKVSLDTSLTGNSSATSIKNHTITAPGIRYAKYTVTDEAGNKSSITITVYISPTYNIVYGKNGGTGTIANTKCYYGIECTMTAQKYTRTGYTFTKWKIGDTLYASSSKVKNLSSTNGASVNATAQWNPITYTLKFDGNGSNSGAVANMTCKYDTNYTLPAATV
ncbi:MAG: prepilin-type N-terminal cleavage/methylation domain-containing protein, partial [Bacilli bacterium]|nr:prepilin-type N-terminal cleavage/methylation domain-containing protein [Bacilli bacterium]